MRALHGSACSWLLRLDRACGVARAPFKGHAPVKVPLHPAGALLRLAWKAAGIQVGQIWP